MSDTLLCSNCGYTLTGIGLGQIMAECPECGTPFDPGQASRPSRWPPTWKLGLWLCGPMLLLGALYLLAWIVSRGGQPGRVAFSNELVAILNQCVLALWFIAPLITAVFLARRYAYSGERWMIGLGLFLAGLVGNTVLVLAAGVIWLIIR